MHQFSTHYIAFFGILSLSPVGAAETDNMEKEIHRMEIRYESLKREQERLSIEMETAITKRGTIQTRYAKPSDTMR